MRSKKATLARAHAIEAARAHTNIAIFHAVAALLESGAVYHVGAGTAYKTAQKIIKLCREESIRQLRLHERHLDLQAKEVGDQE